MSKRERNQKRPFLSFQGLHATPIYHNEKGSPISKKKRKDPSPTFPDANRVESLVHSKHTKSPEAQEPSPEHSYNQVILAQVPYADQSNDSFIQVSILEEMWEVNWVQPIQVKWKQDWIELHSSVKIEIEEVRQDHQRKLLWIKGKLELTGLGTLIESRNLVHETLRLPFTSTVLHPALAKGRSDMRIPAPTSDLPYPQDRWVETGDWSAVLVSDPPKPAPGATREYRGFISIRGRAWWFRKQLLPLQMMNQKEEGGICGGRL